jgi:4-hydroxybenzoate polyprenyltransferase
MRDKTGLVIAVLRPTPSAIAGIGAGAIAWGIGQTSWHGGLGLAFPVTIAVMLGFAFNDLYDIEKDRKSNRADKPLAAGALTVPELIAPLMMLFCAGAIAAIVLAGTKACAAYLALCALVYIYSPFARVFPAAKGIYTAGLCVTPYIVAQIVTGAHIDWLVYALAFWFFLFREMAIDATEVDWDLRADYRTLAAMAGARASTMLGWAGMYLIGVVVFALAVEGGGKFIAAAICLSILGANLIFLRSAAMGLNFSRLPILIAAVSLPFILSR